jgi:phage terminase small subunit
LGELNVRQEKFCIEYAKSGNATRAYINAGYKCKDEKSCRGRASKLLTNDNVKQRLRELHEETKNDSIASIQEIKEFWTKVLRNEEVEDVVGMTEGGPFRLSKDCNIKDRIKAAELLGRTAGLFVDNVNLTGNVPVTFVEDMKSDE